MATKDLVKGYCKESKCAYDVYTKERTDEMIASIEAGIPTLTFDDVPTENSTNPVKSNGVYISLETKFDKSKITSGTAEPTGGEDGDIYFKYS